MYLSNKYWVNEWLHCLPQDGHFLKKFLASPGSFGACPVEFFFRKTLILAFQANSSRVFPKLIGEVQALKHRFTFFRTRLLRIFTQKISVCGHWPSDTDINKCK